ncbi:hypothetical protein E1H12_15815 [Geitlerinema sp. P-1104]|nr:hypothetical protein [Geitlerinema sp. P-1104]
MGSELGGRERGVTQGWRLARVRCAWGRSLMVVLGVLFRNRCISYSLPQVSPLSWGERLDCSEIIANSRILTDKP